MRGPYRSQPGLVWREEWRTAASRPSVCDVFVTLDRNPEFQQDIKVLPFGTVVVRAHSNRMVHLTPLVAGILEAASSVAAGAIARVGA